LRSATHRLCFPIALTFRRHELHSFSSPLEHAVSGDKQDAFLIVIAGNLEFELLDVRRGSLLFEVIIKVGRSPLLSALTALYLASGAVDHSLNIIQRLEENPALISQAVSDLSGAVDRAARMAQRSVNFVYRVNHRPFPIDALCEDIGLAIRPRDADVIQTDN
jgi:hypothetical protein